MYSDPPSPGQDALPSRPGSGTASRILDVAESLFASKGFTETTLRDIAQPLGLTTAGVLHPFGKKSRIYAAVLERVALTLERCVSDAEDVPASDHVARLQGLFLGFVEWTRAYPGYNSLTVRELLDNRERALHAEHWPLAPVLRRMVAIVRQGQNAGLVRKVDPVIAVFHIIGSATYFEPAVLTIMRTDSKRTADQLRSLYVKDVLDLHLRGLLEKPPSGPIPRRRATKLMS